uniref:Ig-like domain-containing protein n=1 Tax=Poecilia latipinna TaxID=48699 RepID=A0A3B3VHY0_9TELE
MESIPSSPVVKRPGESLSLSCRGSGFSFGCCVMIWVRETAGKPLELLGTGFSIPSYNRYASSVGGRVEISREDSNSVVYLRLSNLKPEDSAVYYCAKESAQWFMKCRGCTKTHQGGIRSCKWEMT